jgi:hypothetical protein
MQHVEGFVAMALRDELNRVSPQRRAMDAAPLRPTETMHDGIAYAIGVAPMWIAQRKHFEVNCFGGGAHEIEQSRDTPIMLVAAKAGKNESDTHG